MGKSPGKWIKTKLFGKKSSKSNLSKDDTSEKKTSISKASSKDFNNDSMVISSPVPLVMHTSEGHTELEKTSSVNLTNGTSEVARSTTGMTTTANEDELIRLEQAAIKAQAAFRGYLARREFLSLKCIIRLQAHIRGHLTRKQLQPQVQAPNLEGNLVISTKTEKPKPKPTLSKVSTHQSESVPEQSHSELEKVKQSLRKISVSMAAASKQVPPQPEPEPKPEPEQGPAHPEPEPEPKPEPEPEAEVAMNVESNGKENLKTRRRKSFPEKQEHVECVVQNTPVLPSYMAATESAKAKLRSQAAAVAVAEDGGENGFVRRHSLPSSTGKLSLQSPRVQKPLQANGKGWIKSNKAQICAKDDKMVQSGWKR